MADTQKNNIKLTELPRFIFVSDDLLIRSNNLYCNLEHNLERVAGEILVCDGEGNILKCLVPITYCKDCELYYILEEDYRVLKRKGLILCQIMSYPDYKKYGAYDNNFAKWKDQSPLRIWGYTVSKKHNYTDRQRQIILEDMLDCRNMTKEQVLSYLDFFIRINENKADDTLAKWKSDREYIANYELGSSKRLRVNIKK